MGQVLNGTNPGDIPFDQVTRLELAINLKTAKSLGLDFRQHCLAAQTSSSSAAGHFRNWHI